MKNKQKNIAKEPLLVFLGSWKVEGVNFPLAPNSPEVRVTGTQKVKLMEGDKFLRTDWKYNFNENEHIGISILGTDNDSEKPRMHNFDNLGFYKKYRLKIDDRILNIIGNTERAILEFDLEGRSYEEKWEIKKNGKWQPLCERKGIKI